MNIDHQMWMSQMMKQTGGGYREPKENPGNRRHVMLRVLLALYLAGVCYLVLRNGVNYYLAWRAEGDLQVASSYESIFRSFERVEAKQGRIERKWDFYERSNSPGSGEKSGTGNLSLLMGSGAASVQSDLSGLFGSDHVGIGNYHAPDNGSGTANDDSREENSILTGTEWEEADQIIQQGEFFYVVRPGDSNTWDLTRPSKINLLQYKDATVQSLSEITLKNPDYLSDAKIFVKDDSLIVTGEREGVCRTVVYNVKNKKQPELQTTFQQSGEYVSAKMRDGVFYIVSRYVDMSAAKKQDLESYIPQVNGELIKADDIYMQRDLYYTGFTVLSSYTQDESGAWIPADVKAVAGSGDTIYQADDYIYIFSQVVPKYFDRTNRMGVTQIYCNQGEMQGEGHEVIKGKIDYQIPVYDIEGTLHICVTVEQYSEEWHSVEGWFLPGHYTVPMKILMREAAEESKRRIYLLDKNMKVHTDENIASREQIYQMGFSGCLREFKENILLGMGRMDQEKQLKLLLYRQTETGNLELLGQEPLREHLSAVLEDNQKLFVDVERKMVGFCTDGSRGSVYYLYSCDTESGGLHKILEEAGDSMYRNDWSRGFFQGSYFYIVRSGRGHVVVNVYDTKNWKKLTEWERR